MVLRYRKPSVMVSAIRGAYKWKLQRWVWQCVWIIGKMWIESVQVEKGIPRKRNQNKPREENGKDVVVFKCRYRYKRVVIKNIGYWTWIKFKPLTLPSCMIWSCAYYLISLCLTFSIYKKGIIKLLIKKHKEIIHVKL